MIIGAGSLFRVIVGSKATGIVAIAGGLAQGYVVVGLAATLICEVGAIVLLLRTFSIGHGLRGIFSVLSICMGGLMILLFTLSMWLFWLESHHTFRS